MEGREGEVDKVGGKREQYKEEEVQAHYNIVMARSFLMFFKPVTVVQ